MDSLKSKSDPKFNLLIQWLPSISISLMAFIFVTTEYIPVGLITGMANDFQRTEASIGFLMTIYAWIVALMSLPMTVWTAKLPRRQLVIVLLSVFTVANFISSKASSYETLLVSRIMVALSHSVFWSIATPLGMRLAPNGQRTKALAVIVTGGSLGNVIGIPAGTLINNYMGWRTTFLSLGVISFLVLLIILKILPNVKTEAVGSFKSLKRLFSTPMISLMYLLTAIVITAHFTAFTYISPILEKLGAFSADEIVPMLLLFGVSGIAGSIIASKTIAKHSQAVVMISLFIMLLCLVLFVPFINNALAVGIMCFLWGMALIAATFVFQSKIIEVAKYAQDVAVSLYSGIYNIGIGAGALIGGLFSLSILGYLGAILVGLSLLLYSLGSKKEESKYD